MSREAEQKEAERLSEVEAMRRVEEEFQRKRAREKASIRHQLRIYSMADDEPIMPNGNNKNNNNNNNINQNYSNDWQSSAVSFYDQYSDIYNIYDSRFGIYHHNLLIDI